jgi:hypothetical protein
MRRTGTDQATEYKSQARYYMATFSDGSGQFFPDFRQFIVRASRKLGIEEPEESSDTSKLRSAIRNGLKLRHRYRSEAGEETVPPGLLMSLDALTGTGVALGLMAGRTRGVGGTG